MALPGSGWVNRGLQVLGGRAFSTTDSFAAIQSMSVDDNSYNFAAADTALNTSRGAITNTYAQNFDSTPTRSSQTISMTTTIATGNANFTHRGIALHNITSASVTASSTTLCAGIAGHSFTKNSTFSLAYTLSCTFTDNT